MKTQSTDSTKISPERPEKTAPDGKSGAVVVTTDLAGSGDSVSGDTVSSDVTAMEAPEPRRHKRKSRRKRRASHGKTSRRTSGRRAQSSPPRLLSNSCPDISGLPKTSRNLSYTQTTVDGGEAKPSVRSRKLKRINRVNSADSRHNDTSEWSESTQSTTSLADAPKIGVHAGSQRWCPSRLRGNTSRMSIVQVGNDSICATDGKRKQQTSSEIDVFPPPLNSVVKQPSDKPNDAFPVVQLRGSRLGCVPKPALSTCRRYDARMRGNSPVMFKYSHIFQRRAPTINQFQFNGYISGTVDMGQKPRLNLLRRSIFKNMYCDLYDSEVIDALESGDPNDAIYGKGVAFEGTFPRGLKSILKQPRMHAGRPVDKTVHFAVPNVTNNCRTLRKFVCV